MGLQGGPRRRPEGRPRVARRTVGRGIITPCRMPPRSPHVGPIAPAASVLHWTPTRFRPQRGHGKYAPFVPHPPPVPSTAVTVNNSECPKRPTIGCMLPHGMTKDRPDGLLYFAGLNARQGQCGVGPPRPGASASAGGPPDRGGVVPTGSDGSARGDGY